MWKARRSSCTNQASDFPNLCEQQVSLEEPPFVAAYPNRAWTLIAKGGPLPGLVPGCFSLFTRGLALDPRGR